MTELSRIDRHIGIYLYINVSLRSFGQRKLLLIIYAKLFLNTIINGKSQTLLSDFFEERGGCTQARFHMEDKIIASFLSIGLDDRKLLPSCDQ